MNGQKIDEARLVDGGVLKVGSTEFEFHESATHPTDTQGTDHTQTMIRDHILLESEHPPAEYGLDALRDTERAHDFLTLHQLSMKLLGCTDPDEVVEVSLELLRERLRASVVGFLWASDDGQLKPKLVIPEDAAGKVQLSNELTDLVIRQGKAVWIDNQELERRRRRRSIMRTRSACRCSMAGRRWERSMSIWRKAAFGRAISRSRFRWPTSLPCPDRARAKRC